MEFILSVALTFLLVMDPLGNVPLFITALRSVEPRRRQYVIARELLIALVIIIIFLFMGSQLLNLLHVTQPALGAAGGLILLLIAVRMIFPSPFTPLAERMDDEPFIVPLAVPYIAGPSALATEVIFINQTPDKWASLLVAIIIAWAISAVILYVSGSLVKLLGEKVMIAIERLMGMILIIISMEMLLSGVKAFFLV